MKLIPVLALAGATAALTGGPQITARPTPAPQTACAQHAARVAPFDGYADAPYRSIDEAEAAIRVLDADSGACGFARTYAIARRLVSTVWTVPGDQLRRPTRDAIVRAMRRSYLYGDRDRVQRFGQVRLARALHQAGLVTLPRPWRPTAARWAEGWGPEAHERDLWHGFMRSWLDM